MSTRFRNPSLIIIEHLEHLFLFNKYVLILNKKNKLIYENKNIENKNIENKNIK